jgi:hypothetical protein
MPELDPKLRGTNGEALNKLFIDLNRGLPPGALLMEPWAEELYKKRLPSFDEGCAGLAILLKVGVRPRGTCSCIRAVGNDELRDDQRLLI